MFLYPRCKGLLEEDLASLNYADTIVFRPGVLTGAQRDHAGTMENLVVWVHFPELHTVCL